MNNSDTSVIGTVLDIDGQRAICRLDRQKLLDSRKTAPAEQRAFYSVGGVAKIRVGDRMAFGTLGDVTESRENPAIVHAEIDFMGEGPIDAAGNLTSFSRGIHLYPHPGDEVSFATPEDLTTIFAPPDVPHIQFGNVYPSDSVRAPLLFNQFLGRHFAVVGSSGAGKSTLVSLILDRIVRKTPNAHIVVLDPHGEYASAFGKFAKVWDVGNLQLPFWAMNLDEHCEAFVPTAGDEQATDLNILAKCLQIARSRNVSIAPHARVTADSPIPYRLEDLTQALDDEAGKLEKIADASRYLRLRLNVEQAFRDPRYNFIFNQALADKTLEETLGGFLRIPDEGQPISILDLSGVPTGIINVVISTLSRIILDFAVWSPREGRAPVLLVCEEAHRYLSNDPGSATRSVQKQLERVAREGRKYGVCLGMISQRPSELSDTALSQCGTIISLRLNNISDQEHLKASLPEGARSFVDSIASLKNRECIIAGDGVPVTMRVAIDTLEEELRPASNDPMFSDRWNDASVGEPLIDKAVRRWRGMR